MPQQFYLTADPAPYVPLTWKGLWNKTSDAVDMRLDSTKTTADVTKYTIQRVLSTETGISTPLVPYRVALMRFVSGPLKAQTIKGTMQLMCGVWQSDPAAQLYYAIHMYATQGDSDVVRCTLIAGATPAYYDPLIGPPLPLDPPLIGFAEGGTPETEVNVFPTVPKGRDLILSAAITAGTIRDDDRLVIEIGYIARNIVSIPYAGAMYYGTDFYSNGCPDMQRDI